MKAIRRIASLAAAGVIGAGLFAAEEGGGEPVFRSVWRQSGLLKTKFTNVTIYEGHAYGLSDGILECVRLEDGKRRWKGGRYGQGQVLRVGLQGPRGTQASAALAMARANSPGARRSGRTSRWSDS